MTLRTELGVELGTLVSTAIRALSKVTTEAARACLELNPSFTIARFRSQTFSDDPVYLAGRERMYEGLGKAGMPEK